MLDPSNIRPLSDFQRNAKAHLRRLKRSGQPEVLTVNGRAAVVLQDPKAYQAMLDRMWRLEELAALRQGLQQLKSGKGIPLDQAAATLRARFPRTRPSRRSA
jgi:PHD/YefM family antitoxin component YafN of YafNO toxin-antitoxin module